MTRARWFLAQPWIVAALVAAPLLVAVAAQTSQRWYPVYDLALTELRVRDVGGRHSPLIGLQGRLGENGSHPGPLSFYTLAPIYRLLGSSALALQVATGALHLAAIGTAVWIVHRRRQPVLLLGLGIVLLLLIQGYGLGTLTEPWNPYLPVLWFVTFLVAMWAVVDGDTPMLVPGVVAASLCAQTHLPYVAVTGGIGLVVVGFVTAGLLRGVRVASREPVDGDHPGAASRRSWRWLVGAGVIGFVIWLPPLIDQVVNEPGNVTNLVSHFRDPPAQDMGIRAAVPLVVARLDAWHLAVVGIAHPGTYVDVLSGPGPTEARGQRTLAVWALAVVAAAWMRHRRLLALHGVIAVGGLVAVMAISRIFGVPWPYLMHWAFAIGALMALSIAWTIGALAVRVRPHALRRVAPTDVLLVAGAVVLLAGSVRLLVIAPDARPHTPERTAQLGRVTPPTVDALAEEVGSATGRAGRYLVYWDDALHGGSVGIGLVNELIREGYDVGVADRDAVKMVPFRVRRAADATARIVVATGAWIEHWERQPGAVQVAYDDTRTAPEREEYAALRDEVITALRGIGRADLVEEVDLDLFDLALNSGLPPEFTPPLGRMIDLDIPLAVFVLPPGGQ